MRDKVRVYCWNARSCWNPLLTQAKTFPCLEIENCMERLPHKHHIYSERNVEQARPMHRRTAFKVELQPLNRSRTQTADWRICNHFIETVRPIRSSVVAYLPPSGPNHFFEAAHIDWPK